MVSQVIIRLTVCFEALLPGNENGLRLPSSLSSVPSFFLPSLTRMPVGPKPPNYAVAVSGMISSNNLYLVLIEILSALIKCFNVPRECLSFGWFPEPFPRIISGRWAHQPER